MSRYEPLAGAPGDPVAWSGDAAFGGTTPAWSYADLCAQAQAVARALDAADDVLLLCEDRYWFTAGLLGAWQAGRQVVLPPHRGTEAVARLAAEHFVLHDGDAAHFERACDVRRLPVEGARSLDSIDPERHLLTLYTSGSTGQPRAWTKRARQLLGEAQVLAQRLRIQRADRVLPTVAPHHIYGLLFGVLAPLAAGASFVRTTPLHAETIFGCAERTGARWLVSVPAHLQVLSPLLHRRLAPSDPAAARHWAVGTAVSSGAPLDEATARQLRSAGLEVLDVLGSTETGGLALRRAGLESSWTPLDGVRVQVDSEERLLVQSPFLDDPAQAHVTGDRGRVEPDGRFEHLGRADDVVKIGGKRASLGEIEAHVRDLPGVSAVAALRRQVGGIRNEEIWLAVVAPELTSATLRNALRERLDPVFVPRKIRLVTALPREPGGKLRRDALHRLFEESESREEDTPSRYARLARVELQVPQGGERFDGHFPGNPVLPAVAQLHDLVLPLVRSTWSDLEHPTEVRRLKFLRPLRGGERVTVALERNETKVRFQLRERDHTVATGTLWFRLTDPPPPPAPPPEDDSDVR